MVGRGIAKQMTPADVCIGSNYITPQHVSMQGVIGLVIYHIPNEYRAAQLLPAYCATVMVCVRLIR